MTKNLNSWFHLLGFEDYNDLMQECIGKEYALYINTHSGEFFTGTKSEIEDILDEWLLEIFDQKRSGVSIFDIINDKEVTAKLKITD